MKVAGSWLCVDGTEAASGARVLAYLRNGLGGPYWDAAIGDDCTCPQLTDDSYIDPATDEAPWYVAARPQSADFLGVMLDDLEDRQPVGRTVRRLATGGAAISPFIPSERTAGFTATLFARSTPGMEWGRRWLTDVVSGGLCSDCWGLSEFKFLPACPDDPDDETAYRSFELAGLIDPPQFSAVGNVAECLVMQARWQIAAGVPWLVGPPVVAEAADGVLLESGETVNVLVEHPEWVGDTAVNFTVAADVANADGVHIVAYPMAEGWTCPEPGTPSPCYDVTIDDLPPFGVVTIEASLDKATYWNPTTKRPEPPWPHLSFESSAPFLVVPACSSVCVQVTNDAAGDVFVTIETVAREL